MRRGGLAVGAVAPLATIPAAAVITTMSDAAAHGDSVSTTRVDPSSTGAGITAENDVARYHVVSLPLLMRTDRLVVMLPGSSAAASGYTGFTQHAAGLGFPAVSLSYPNRGTVGAVCQATPGDEHCFAQARGEIVFGADVPDPRGVRYSSDKVNVDSTNSIVGRLIALIDHQASQDPRWNGFLIPDKASPYTAAHRGPVRLNYDKLIVAGHSQGGGHAAFLAMRTKVARVVMLSSPDDTDQSGTASWVRAESATPLERFWGLIHEHEGPFGQHVAQVWSELGGAGVGGDDDASQIDVGDGSGDPHDSHRLVLAGDLGDPLANHMATAYDGAYPAGVPAAWTYLLTKN